MVGRVQHIQFDTKRLLSSSDDGTLRIWFWGDSRATGEQKRKHWLAPGETLRDLAKGSCTIICN